ncbi:MAG: hypothetical protein EBR09_09870 [Proteobacteria bacterium]|nr:hypothetical protein [Pseudomonadota bacterium]
MKPNSFESDYAFHCASLQSRADELISQWPALAGFWNRWCKEHLATARKLSGREFKSSDDGSSWTELLTRRQRMISALSQGLKTAGFQSAEFRESLMKFLAEHDTGFKRLLQKELESVREQMTFAFSVKKTMNAYAQTAQYRRE